MNHKVLLIKFFFLILIIIIFSIPSFILAPVSINFFDEPYQILNAYEPLNSPLAPLTALIGSWWGKLFNWEWIYFRYLSLIMNILTVSLASFFLFFNSSKNYLTIIFITASCVLFNSIFKNLNSIYGWDNTTYLFSILTLIITILFFQHKHIYLLVLTGIFSGITCLMRIPNLIIIPILSFLIFFNKNESSSISLYLKYILIYLCSAFLTIFIIIILLYGTFNSYIYYFSNNPIGSHSLRNTLLNYFSSIINFLPYISLLWSIYHILNLVITIHNKKLITFTVPLSIIIIFYILFNNHSTILVNVILIGISLSILGISAIVYNNYNLIRTGPTFYAIIIFLFCCIPFIGSNTGIIKFIAFPAIPIIVAILDKNYIKPMKIYGMICAVSLLGYSYTGIRNGAFFDVGTRLATFTLRGGVLNGMKTSEEKGKFIQDVYDNFSPYNIPENNVLVLRTKTDFIWEYMFLNRNDFLGSKFDYKDGFENKDYAKWAESKILNSNKPMAVLYMAPDSTKKTIMQYTLEKHLKKNIVKDKYIVYISPESCKPD